LADFDAEARLAASNATNLDELRAQFGDVGAENGPRIGTGRRTQVSNEAYLARRFFFWKAKSGLLNFPVTIFHEDKPDFRVQENGTEYGLEVTEACDPGDGAEMARLQDEPSPQLLGAKGGRGVGGYSGNEPEIEVIHDIKNAVGRKAAKPYVDERPTDLLIYVNSNPSRVINREEHFRMAEKASFDLGTLRHVHLFWSSDRIVQLG
jgi:hypothetical protein